MVQYIPSNFLYDGNGVMIAKGLRGKALEAKLAEVMEYYFLWKRSVFRK